MKVLLTMYNSIKAFINNMYPFDIFKTSQKNVHVTFQTGVLIFVAFT